MKREEEIKKQAKEFVDNYMQSCIDYRSLGYHQRKTLLNVDLYKVEDVYEEAANWADKTMLDRACSIFSDILIEICPELLGYGACAKVWENKFRKRLEGGAE